jgi:hypothetical protein
MFCQEKYYALGFCQNHYKQEYYAYLSKEQKEKHKLYHAEYYENHRQEINNAKRERIKRIRQNTSELIASDAKFLEFYKNFSATALNVN